jgi:hypothetical protein
MIRGIIGPTTQRIDRLQRPGLPSGDLLQDRVGDDTDQVGRDVQPIKIAQMADDLAVAHTPGVHRDDLLVEVGESPLVLPDKLGIEASLAIPWNLQRQFTGAGHHRFPAIAVAAVGGLVLAAQMVVHLGIQGALGQRLLQLVEQATRVKGSLGLGSSQQLVEDRVRYRRLFASGHGAAPFFPLCPAHTRNS